MSCLTLHVSTSRVSRYASVDKRMSTPCLSSYYSLPQHFDQQPTDDCVACPSYFDSPAPLCDNVYSRIIPFIPQRIKGESLTLLRKLMISPKLQELTSTELGAELALGSSGTVVLANVPSSNSTQDREEVAIKLFNPLQPLQLEEEYFQQHAHEIYIACLMEHENIVHTHRATYQDHQLSLVMEYCPHDFFNLITSNTLTPPKINDYFYQMVNGVRFLHRNGIAHRDLKLDNFMVGLDGTLKIVDFGFACITRTCDQTTSIPSQGLWGSDPYMAPEIFTGNEYDAEKADVWSLGIIYIACVTNRFPWEVAKEEDSHYAQYVTDPPTLSRILPNPESVNLILRMLQPNPNLRPNILDIYSDPWFASILGSHMELKLFGSTRSSSVSLSPDSPVALSLP